MGRPKKIEAQFTALPVSEGMCNADKRTIFIAAALTGLLARGNGVNADATIASAVAYADAVLLRLESNHG